MAWLYAAPLGTFEPLTLRSRCRRSERVACTSLFVSLGSDHYTWHRSRPSVHIYCYYFYGGDQRQMQSRFKVFPPGHPYLWVVLYLTQHDGLRYTGDQNSRTRMLYAV